MNNNIKKNVKNIKRSISAISFALLGVALTLTIKIFETALVGGISPDSDVDPIVVGQFIYSEYSVVGPDLIIIAFSLIAGTWISGKPETARVDALFFVIVISLIAAIGVKGWSAGSIERVKSEIILIEITPILENQFGFVPGKSNLVKKFQEAISECEKASKEKNRKSDFEKACSTITSFFVEKQFASASGQSNLVNKYQEVTSRCKEPVKEDLKRLCKNLDIYEKAHFFIPNFIGLLLMGWALISLIRSNQSHEQTAIQTT